MSEEKQKINVYQTRTFEKALNKLDDLTRDLIDEQIDLIIDNPEIGTLKKGDLSHVRVHKFKINNEQILLGYNWHAGKVTLTLLSIGPHENFYRDMKKRRQADLKVLDN
jgi:mRNA-degrading endonuclease RelE of RelBE toxin-antitoxin system